MNTIPRRALAALWATATLAAVLWCPPTRAAADGCGSRDVRQFVAAVPSVSAALVPAGPEASAREQTLANPDDARIALTARLVPQAAGPDMTRRAYVAEVQRHLDALPSRPGVTTAGAVDPGDPVSWSVSRQVSGDVPSSTGEDVVLLSRTCRFALDWQVPDVPVLQGRIASFRKGLDALHASVSGKAEAVAFLDEDYTPTGTVAAVLGLALPLGVAAVLAFFALRVSEGAAPGRRAGAALCCAAAVAGLAVAVPAALGDMGAGGRYLDGVALLVVVAAASALAAATRARLASAASLSTSVAAGISLGAATSLDWVPDPLAMAVVAAALVATGSYQAWDWLSRAAPSRAEDEARDEAAPGDGAPAGA